MDVNFEKAQIKGVLNIIPEQKKIDSSGIERFCVKENTFTKDLFIYGMNYLLQNGSLSKNDIGAMVTVSCTPDYMIPQLSFCVHDALELPDDVLCSDILEENTGYIKGLLDAMLIAEYLPEDKKVVLLCGNITDKRKEDKVPFYGNDGASITVIGHSDKESICSFSCLIDSQYINDIKKHSGGFKDLFHQNGNLYTNNIEKVSMFVQEKIPEVIMHLAENARICVDDIDFISIPENLGISFDKVFDSLGTKSDFIVTKNCGINDSISNSLHIADRYMSGNKEDDSQICCLFGYGAGINYCGAILELKQLEFCDTIQSNL